MEYQNFYEEEKAFFKIKKSLYKKHKGKYIAVKDGKIIDRDKNSSKLAERVYKKFNPPFYIDKIITERDIAYLLSPKTID